MVYIARGNNGFIGQVVYISEAVDVSDGPQARRVGEIVAQSETFARATKQTCPVSRCRGVVNDRRGNL